MFLHKDEICTSKIKFNTYNYPNNYKFIKIKYDKNDLLIQTPKLFSQYGIYNDYLTLSLFNKDNSNSVQNLLNQFNKINDYIFNKFKNCNINKFIVNDIFKCKIYKLLIFNNYKKKIDKIYPNTYGNYIIHLNGLWIDDNDNLYFNWHVIQAKIDLPFYMESYGFINENKKNIPPPPPLPPSFLQTKQKSLKQIINSSKKNNKKMEIDNYKVPSLDDIKNAILKLNKIK